MSSRPSSPVLRRKPAAAFLEAVEPPSLRYADQGLTYGVGVGALPPGLGGEFALLGYAGNAAPSKRKASTR